MMHPLVQDADEEEQFVAIQKMNDAALAAQTNEVAQGTKSTSEVARTAELVSEGMPVFKAMLQAAAEVASQGPAPGAGGPDVTAPPGPGGAPSAPLPPGLQQLLAANGAGPTSPPGATIPSPNPDLMSLRHTIQGISEQMSPTAT